MHFSPIFKSSPQCGVSPDGRWFAALLSSTIIVRSTETLQTVNAVKLPQDLSGPFHALIWSPSSTRVLISTSDQLQVFSALDASFHAVVRNPLAGTKPAHIQFGIDDSELLVFSSFGLKLLIFNLSTSKGSEVSSPKFHLPSTVSRTYALRPETGHLALLTRVSGRDIVSIHCPITRQVQRSWATETIDAQSLSWSPDGQLLLLRESAAYGWRLVLYTPDGQLVRTLDETSTLTEEDVALRTGIKSSAFSPDGCRLAVGDHGRTVTILDTGTWRRSLRLVHPSTISPSDTLQVWQEKLYDSATDNMLMRSFHRATQQVLPPSSFAEAKTPPDSRSGCSEASFDASSGLLATRMDASPSTLWIWDLAAMELRSVLIFHSPIEFIWHPKVCELLLITCREEEQGVVPFVWDPLSEGPKPVLPADLFPGTQITGKLQVNWRNLVSGDSDEPMLWLSDSQHYRLLLVADGEPTCESWKVQDISQLDAGSIHTNQGSTRDGTADASEGADDTSLLDDTFSFKHVARADL